MQLTIVRKNNVNTGVSLDDLEEIRRDATETGASFWLDVETPDADEMSRVAEIFGLHPMTAADCLNRLVPVKWEVFPEYLYVVSHGLNFNAGADLLDTLNLSILVFPDCCLTVHTHPLRSVRSLLDGFGSGAPSVRNDHADEILYGLLDASCQLYGALVEQVEDEVEQVDDAVLAGSDLPNILERMSEARKHLAVLRRRMSPMREHLQQLALRDNRFVRDESRVYLRDVLDGVIRNLEKSDVVRETLTTAQANYLAQLANQTNEVMKTLSIVATIMMPLSFLTGLFGMNVHVPGQETAGLFWFGGLLLGMLGVALVLVRLFRKRGWL